MAEFKEIMAMWLEGKSYDAIASALGCSNREIPYRAGSTGTALAKGLYGAKRIPAELSERDDSWPSQPQACGASDEEMRPARLQQEAPCENHGVRFFPPDIPRPGQKEFPCR
ncbi:helix-turn-helix domain-containing protein [Corynebacterium lizhenjunii]|uniref:Helix-turn-helix domain-containing protein n=1 Tax=Corynebacterium lizhenjunii TaxID=2709394 RepID=A0A7T0P9H7_9CORY|nr:helix-turn-helix domain-containing protein [Corynebacterium lizhenjunii]QPK78793.1 helix-turn-helix domain-containing protein [Corynebacterium lizhenjunii]